MEPSNYVGRSKTSLALLRKTIYRSNFFVSLYNVVTSKPPLVKGWYIYNVFEISWGRLAKLLLSVLIILDDL